MSDTLRKLNAYLVANEPRRDDAAEPPLTGRFSGSSPPAARGGNIMDDADAVGSPYTPDDLPSPALLPVGAPTTADPQQAPPRPAVPQKAPKVIERNAVACLTCRQAKVRCDIVHQPQDQLPVICSRCRRLNRDCTIAPKAAPRGRHSKAKGTPEGSSPRSLSTTPSSANPLGLLADASQSAIQHIWRPRALPGAPNTMSSLLDMPGYPHPHIPRANTPPQPPPPRMPVTAPRLHLPGDGELRALRVSRLALMDGLDLIASGGEQRAVVATVGESYFANRPYGTSRRDVGSEVDPIDLGVIDPIQLPGLFAYFFTHIHPLAPILDPELHTPEFVRPRSALLLTAIALVAAQAMPGESMLATRLHHHAEQLRQITFTRGLCSLELLQGHNILACWPRSARRAEDDRSSAWLAFATSMALELGIDRDLELKKKVRSPIQKEPGLELPSHLEARYIRSRERAYIAIFVWERSLALATGRSWTFSDTTISAVFDGWERDAVATPGDPLLVDMVTLRCMMSDVRTAVLRIQADESVEQGTAIPQLVLDFVRTRIDPWQPRIKSGGPNAGAALPYRQEASLSIVQGQTRLWALALGLPHAGAGPVGTALLSSTWRAAIDSCEAIVLHADAMRYLPASISVMLVYSALLALTLHPPERDSLPRAGLLGLVAQVSRFLTDSGSLPSHREGPNAVYGTHLLLVLQDQANRAVAKSPAPSKPASRAISPTGALAGGGDLGFMPWPPAFAASAGLNLDGFSTDGVDSWPQFDWLFGGGTTTPPPVAVEPSWISVTQQSQAGQAMQEDIPVGAFLNGAAGV